MSGMTLEENAMKKKKEITYFGLTQEECKNVFDAIDGLVVIDQKGIIKYLSPDLFGALEELYGIELPQKVVGKSIHEIHPTSKISSAFAKEEQQEAYFYLSDGFVSVARIKPVYDQGQIAGAIDYDLFTDSWQLQSFAEKLETVLNGTIMTKNKGFGNVSEFYNKKKESKYMVADIIGKSLAIERIRQKIYNLVESDSTVLITGESGVGKEVVAQAIHSSSMRSRFPMVEVNCASIPEHLFESELFGYEEGSFTGAARGGRQGRFQMADKGTIFLDEIDQIPYHMQPKLLRVLQEKEVVTVGGKKIKIDIRIISATNKDLKKLVEEGLFREDLYYRLDVINMEIPPLRQRTEDIPLLAQAHIQRLNPILNKAIIGITQEAVDILKEYDWPGNIRELFNAIERAMNECSGDTLESKHFKELNIARLKEFIVDEPMEAKENLLGKLMDDTEKRILEKALKLNDWNITATAEFLGISRPSLHYKIKKYNLSKKDDRG